MDRKQAARYIVNGVGGLAGMGVALFWPAGRLDWWQAWAAIAVMGAWLAAMDVIILGRHPELLAERLQVRQGTKSWDVTLTSLVRLAQLARYVLAGLDLRHGWTGGFPAGAQIAALVACALGYALFSWAVASNAYFSHVVRIQSERGHTVARGGPYRMVRHPAYLGAILYDLAVPILLGSWWAAAVSGVAAILLVVRTALEDRTLLAELDGYAEYAGRVRFRLLPGVW